MNKELIKALEGLESEKGIKKETVILALEEALASAYRKVLGREKEIEVKVDPSTGEIKVFDIKKVVADVDLRDLDTEIKYSEAVKIDKKIKLGSELKKEIIMDNRSSRIAAQTAKQIIIQKIREAEKDKIYEEYKNRVGEIVVGVVRRFERGNTILEIDGNVEILLEKAEQLPRERFRISERVKTIIIEVEKQGKGPTIKVSRCHPDLVKKMFEEEIPEIQEGIVEIKAVAREPGVKSKVAVVSYKDKVDPVGACVGYRGTRVQVIISELRGEKMDIVRWNEDIEVYLMNALAPVKMISMKIVGEEDGKRVVEAIVSDENYAQVVGKDGQNVRLISELLNIKLKIINESEYKKFVEDKLFSGGDENEDGNADEK